MRKQNALKELLLATVHTHTRTCAHTRKGLFQKVYLKNESKQMDLERYPQEDKY